MHRELKTNLTVKWMFACGGSWAWEASNLVSVITGFLVAVSFQSKPSELCWQFARFSEGTQQGCAGAAVAKVAGYSDCDRCVHVPCL
jgi:hypothetical protein